jgi:hypothetical protein
MIRAGILFKRNAISGMSVMLLAGILSSGVLVSPVLAQSAPQPATSQADSRDEQVRITELSGELTRSA